MSRKRGRDETKETQEDENDNESKQETVLQRTQRLIQHAMAQPQQPGTGTAMVAEPLLQIASEDLIKLVMEYLNISDFVRMQSAIADEKQDYEYVTRLHTSMVEHIFTAEDRKLMRVQGGITAYLQQVAATTTILDLGDIQDYGRESYGHPHIPASAWKIIRTMPKLQVFRIRNFSHWIRMSISDDDMAFRTPNLKSFSFDVENSQSSDTARLIQSFPSSLQYLSLTLKEGNHGNVPKILGDRGASSFPNLTHVNVDYSYDPPILFDYQSMAEACPRLQVMRMTVYNGFDFVGEGTRPLFEKCPDLLEVTMNDNMTNKFVSWTRKSSQDRWSVHTRNSVRRLESLWVSRQLDTVRLIESARWTRLLDRILEEKYMHSIQRLQFSRIGSMEDEWREKTNRWFPRERRAALMQWMDERGLLECSVRSNDGEDFAILYQEEQKGWKLKASGLYQETILDWVHDWGRFNDIEIDMNVRALTSEFHFSFFGPEANPPPDVEYLFTPEILSEIGRLAPRDTIERLVVGDLNHRARSTKTKIQMFDVLPLRRLLEKQVRLKSLGLTEFIIPLPPSSPLFELIQSLNRLRSLALVVDGAVLKRHVALLRNLKNLVLINTTGERDAVADLVDRVDNDAIRLLAQNNPDLQILEWSIRPTRITSRPDTTYPFTALKELKTLAFVTSTNTIAIEELAMLQTACPSLATLKIELGSQAAIHHVKCPERVADFEVKLKTLPSSVSLRVDYADGSATNQWSKFLRCERKRTAETKGDDDDDDDTTMSIQEKEKEKDKGPLSRSSTQAGPSVQRTTHTLPNESSWTKKSRYEKRVTSYSSQWIWWMQQVNESSHQWCADHPHRAKEMQKKITQLGDDLAKRYLHRLKEESRHQQQVQFNLWTCRQTGTWDLGHAHLIHAWSSWTREHQQQALRVMHSVIVSQQPLILKTRRVSATFSAIQFQLEPFPRPLVHVTLIHSKRTRVAQHTHARFQRLFDSLLKRMGFRRLPVLLDYSRCLTSVVF